ncbi:hypothetical protein [Olleya marilimosa]|uniref:hypothetical protein n=1 Tax=Olleya marilimosa TaxID=272164 RepID=UPI0030ECC88B|tara:strand:- start:80138 stop:80680 length:543 start_codon:yes stop_codon:yes gene_type:complete
MEQITNYKLKDFFKQDITLIQDYINILQHLEPVPTKNEVFHLKLKEVEFIKNNLSNDDDEALFEILAMVQGVKESQILNTGIIEIFGLINSVKEQLERIQKAEASSLVSDNTNIKWETVNGSERMAKFGIYNTLDALSDGDILKWDAILELKFSDVFMKLLLNKTKNDLESEMNNIKTKH